MLKDFSLYCVTWNVCGQQPTEDLSSLLGVPKTKSSHVTLPDLYFISLQEVNSQPQNMFLDLLFDDPWTQAFSSLLKNYNYIRLKVERLQGIVNMIFIKRNLLCRVTGLETEITRTGLGGMWGNKGAATVRFNLCGCSLCFVNSHLSAHLEDNEKRVNEYSLILDGQEFKDPQINRIITHDYVFWSGDLNFRIQGKTAEEVVSMIHAKDYESLLELDQLRRVMKSGEAFSEFQESDPKFDPTYKFIVGTDGYIPTRVPSWTDRVVYRFTPNAYDGVTLEANQQHYKDHISYKQSDHKPVSSSFIIKVFCQTIIDEIQFYSIDNWWTNTDNIVFYKVSDSVKISSYDWIGLYKADFMSINEYLCYVWASMKPVTDTDTSRKDDTQSSSSNNASSSHCNKMLPVHRVVVADQNVILPGYYRLVYVSNQFSNVLGVSDPFQVKVKK